MRWSICILSLILLTGCFTFSNKGKNANSVNKAKDQITLNREEFSQNQIAKIEQVSVLAAGTQRSLSQITNPPVQVKTAQELNQKVISIVGAPDIDELNKINLIVDLLNSESEKERKRGEKLLAEKDTQILQIQTETRQIKSDYEALVQALTKRAEVAAANADGYKASLNEMNKWFGLGAVFYGLKRFIFTSLTVILIFAVIFFALRIFSSTNPIAGAVFSVFEQIASWFIYLIKGLTPNAPKVAKLIDQDYFNGVKETLVWVVKKIEEYKDETNPEAKVKITDLLDDLSQAMDKKHKEIIKRLKSEYFIK